MVNPVTHPLRFLSGDLNMLRLSILWGSVSQMTGAVCVVVGTSCFFTELKPLLGVNEAYAEFVLRFMFGLQSYGIAAAATGLLATLPRSAVRKATKAKRRLSMCKVLAEGLNLTACITLSVIVIVWLYRATDDPLWLWLLKSASSLPGLALETLWLRTCYAYMQYLSLDQPDLITLPSYELNPGSRPGEVTEPLLPESTPAPNAASPGDQRHARRQYFASPSFFGFVGMSPSKQPSHGGGGGSGDPASPSRPGSPSRRAADATGSAEAVRVHQDRSLSGLLGVDNLAADDGAQKRGAKTEGSDEKATAESVESDMVEVKLHGAGGDTDGSRGALSPESQGQRSAEEPKAQPTRSAAPAEHPGLEAAGEQAVVGEAGSQPIISRYLDQALSLFRYRSSPHKPAAHALDTTSPDSVASGRATPFAPAAEEQARQGTGAEDGTGTGNRMDDLRSLPLGPSFLSRGSGSLMTPFPSAELRKSRGARSQLPRNLWAGGNVPSVSRMSRRATQGAISSDEDSPVKAQMASGVRGATPFNHGSAMHMLSSSRELPDHPATGSAEPSGGSNPAGTSIGDGVWPEGLPGASGSAAGGSSYNQQVSKSELPQRKPSMSFFMTFWNPSTRTPAPQVSAAESIEPNMSFKTAHSTLPSEAPGSLV